MLPSSFLYLHTGNGKWRKWRNLSTSEYWVCTCSAFGYFKELDANPLRWNSIRGQPLSRSTDWSWSAGKKKKKKNQIFRVFVSFSHSWNRCNTERPVIITYFWFSKWECILQNGWEFHDVALPYLDVYASNMRQTWLFSSLKFLDIIRSCIHTSFDIMKYSVTKRSCGSIVYVHCNWFYANNSVLLHNINAVWGICLFSCNIVLFGSFSNLLYLKLLPVYCSCYCIWFF